MRILQLIDSLDPGGAERVAVQYANHLNGHSIQSFLCTSRKEGLLKQQIAAQVGYLFLNRKHTLDVFALRRLIGFCKTEKIDLIHAHASSFFLAFLAKLFLPKIGFIWHDHYGNSEHLKDRPYTTLRFASRYMDAILSVNYQLRDWAITNLKCKRVEFVSNTVGTAVNSQNSSLELKGVAGYRIVCLANFRPQKDHFNLLEAFERVQSKVPSASLHLVGKNWNDSYYKQVIDEIDKSVNKKNIFNYGAQPKVHLLLVQADIGVLSSNSEGLPMALLEYGAAGLGVVATSVGQCESVIANKSYTVPPRNSDALANALLELLLKPEELIVWKREFRKRIKAEYSIGIIIPKLKAIYQSSLSK